MPSASYTIDCGQKKKRAEHAYAPGCIASWPARNRREGQKGVPSSQRLGPPVPSEVPRLACPCGKRTPRPPSVDQTLAELGYCRPAGSVVRAANRSPRGANAGLAAARVPARTHARGRKFEVPSCGILLYYRGSPAAAAHRFVHEWEWCTRALRARRQQNEGIKIRLAAIHSLGSRL